jgi:hypothetical protein
VSVVPRESNEEKLARLRPDMLSILISLLETTLPRAPDDKQATIRKTIETMVDLRDEPLEGKSPAGLLIYLARRDLAVAHGSALLRYSRQAKAEQAKLAREVNEAQAAERHEALVRDIRDRHQSLGRWPTVKIVRNALEKRDGEAPGRNRVQAALKDAKRRPVDN